MKTYTFRTIIEPDDPKGYHGFVPILPGLHTCGDTIEEVKKNLKDAIRCHIAGFSKHHQAGSHIQLKHPDGRRTTLPYHPSQEIRRGTLKGIIFYPLFYL